MAAMTYPIVGKEYSFLFLKNRERPLSMKDADLTAPPRGFLETLLLPAGVTSSFVNTHGLLELNGQTHRHLNNISGS